MSGAVMRGLSVVAAGIVVSFVAVVLEGYFVARSGGPVSSDAAMQTHRLFSFGIYPALVILLGAWAGRSVGSRRGGIAAVLASAPIAAFVLLSGSGSTLMTTLGIAYVVAAAATALLVSARMQIPTG
jgi:hypothetical protein